MAYCTLTEVRAEGLTSAAASDERVGALIAEAGDFIDRATRQWFEPRTLTLRFSGHGGKILSLPVYPLQVQGVTVDGATVTDAEVGGDIPNAARHNPRIIREDGWPLGAKVAISGQWGCCDVSEADGVRTFAVPAAIRRAAIALVLRSAPKMSDPEYEAARLRSRIQSETTDGHSYTLRDEWESVQAPFTGDVEIDSILLFFRAPIRIAGV